MQTHFFFFLRKTTCSLVKDERSYNSLKDDQSGSLRMVSNQLEQLIDGSVFIAFLLINPSLSLVSSEQILITFHTGTGGESKQVSIWGLGYFNQLVIYFVLSFCQTLKKNDAHFKRYSFYPQG